MPVFVRFTFDLVFLSFFIEVNLRQSRNFNFFAVQHLFLQVLHSGDVLLLSNGDSFTAEAKTVGALLGGPTCSFCGSLVHFLEELHVPHRLRLHRRPELLLSSGLALLLLLAPASSFLDEVFDKTIEGCHLCDSLVINNMWGSSIK